MRSRLPTVLLVALLLPSVALGQDADTFDVSGSNLDGQGTLQRHHPHLHGTPTWYSGLGLVYANDPLVLVDEQGNETTLVSSQVSARLQGGYNFGGKARLDVSLPTYPSVNVGGEGQFALGDVRLGALVPLVAYEDEGVGVAVTPYVSLPTGDETAFVTNGGMGGGLVASVGGQSGQLGWVVDAGIDLGKPATLGTTTVGSGIDAGAGVSYRVADPFVLGLEFDQKVNLAESISRSGNPLEGHLYGTYGECGGFYATGALGTGIIAGVGSPDLRVAAVLGWRGAECGPFDSDGDGIMDGQDACPDVPEDMDGYLDNDGCPDDNDGDGVPDEQDACPSVAGAAELDGCPDGDGDGLSDIQDDCPTVPGPKELKGCPDRDGDGFLDKDDACPDEAGGQKSKDGCPIVVVTKKAIRIGEKVLFETDGDRILSSSFELLDAVAQVMNDNLRIKRVEIQGHTDDRGSDSYNDALSNRRARSVREYLMKAGVAPKRLLSKGYGESAPIVEGESSEARTQNRRVEFRILEQ
jgi:outer membrane protein OmpA-like peptidoglycan-associated protein